MTRKTAKRPEVTERIAKTKAPKGPIKGFIYKITSPSGRIYIGQTKNLKSRINSYRFNNAKGQPKLYNSFIKYGFDNHQIICIEEINYEYLNEREIYWINKLNCIEDGLNCTTGGFNFNHTKETKEKLRIIKTGLKASAETKEKMSNARKGKDNYFFGKTHSEETKEKISNLSKNKKFSKERVLKMSNTVTIENIIYLSLRIASEILDIKYSILKSRVRSKSESFKNYYYNAS